MTFNILGSCDKFSNKTKLLLIAKIYFFMFVNGFINSFESCTFERVKIQHSYDIVPEEFCIRAIGYLFYAILSSYLPMRVTEILTFSIMCVSFILLFFPKNYILFIYTYTLYLFSKSFLMASLASYGCVILTGKNKALLINILHFFYGIGMLIGNALSEFNNLDVNSYIVINLLLLLLCITISSILTSSINEIHDAEEKRIPVYQVMTIPIVYVLSVLMFTMRLTENGLLNDVNNYFSTVYPDYMKSLSVDYTTGILLFYTFSRCFFGAFIDRIGHIKSLFFLLLFLLLVIILGIVSHQYGLWFFFVSGLFLGPLFPTCITIISDLLTEDILIHMDLILCFSYFLCSLFHTFLESILFHYNAITEMWSFVGYLVLSLLLLIYVYYVFKKKQNTYEYTFYLLPL